MKADRRDQSVYDSASEPKSSIAKHIAANAPASCATMNIGTSVGVIPEKLLAMLRAIVIAGLAKLVDDVSQYGLVTV